MVEKSLLAPNPSEYDIYGVLTEAFIFHKRPYDRYTIFPQFYLHWKPNNPTDRRGSIPDFVLGHYIERAPWIRLIGGAEVKRAAPLVMKGLPAADTVSYNSGVQDIIADARFQARDQIVSAIKEGRLPSGQRIKWLIFVGPYFAEVEFGPFTDLELRTRAHKPNISGDLVELMITRIEKLAEPVCIPLYLLGTKEAEEKLENYIEEGKCLYESVLGSSSK
ncbi:hypothetical protein APHAL10511_000583 [Amanita phalloides]|nr:hypothetical protein APHAL10511_000583 [Amanita phalloides]